MLVDQLCNPNTPQETLAWVMRVMSGRPKVVAAPSLRKHFVWNPRLDRESIYRTNKAFDLVESEAQPALAEGHLTAKDVACIAILRIQADISPRGKMDPVDLNYAHFAAIGLSLLVRHQQLQDLGLAPTVEVTVNATLEHCSRALREWLMEASVVLRELRKPRTWREMWLAGALLWAWGGGNREATRRRWEGQKKKILRLLRTDRRSEMEAVSNHSGEIIYGEPEIIESLCCSIEDLALRRGIMYWPRSGPPQFDARQLRDALKSELCRTEAEAVTHDEPGAAGDERHMSQVRNRHAKARDRRVTERGIAVTSDPAGSKTDRVAGEAGTAVEATRDSLCAIERTEIVRRVREVLGTPRRSDDRAHAAVVEYFEHFSRVGAAPRQAELAEHHGIAETTLSTRLRVAWDRLRADPVLGTFFRD